MPRPGQDFLLPAEEQLLHVTIPLVAHYGAKGQGDPAAYSLGNGDCIDALESALAALLPDECARAESAADWFERLSALDRTSQANRLNTLIAGASALCEFILCNTTGPDDHAVPSCPADLFRDERIGDDRGKDETGDRQVVVL